MKKMFLFSGQGTQYSGMGRELAALCSKSAEIFRVGSEILGYDLEALCCSGSEAELSKTRNSQPAIMAVSLLAWETARQNGLYPDGVAGHSLGEYAAMVASGMLSLEEGFRVIKLRASAMRKAEKSAHGAMAAILGKTPAEVEEICSLIDGYVIAVNYNSPTQTVIAGEADAVERAMAQFGKIGAKAIKLNVSAAFHSAQMQSASEDFFEKIKNIQFKAPSCSFYSNVFGRELIDFSQISTLLSRHMVSPVLFTKELAAISADGFDTFIECGPGKVLTGLVKKTLPTDKICAAVNIEGGTSLERALSEVVH